MVAVLVLALASQARAATQLGQIAPTNPNGCAEGNLLQFTIDSGTSYEVPPGGGVITQWQSMGRMPSAGTGRFQVWRFIPTVGYALVGRSAVESFTAGAAPLYPVRIPVLAGDILGLHVDGVAGCEFSTASMNDVEGFDSSILDPAPGDTLPFFTGVTPRRENVAARLEPDLDADGFGDETQDNCLGQTGPNNGCPGPSLPGTSDTAPPNGKIGKKPKKRTTNRKAKFTFSSDEAGSTFTCKLDRKPFEACASPFKKRVRPSKHRFQVEAIDAAGNVDPTPASYRWKVLPG
jgi:hypothetical protein